jgi:hypothetical protein
VKNVNDINWIEWMIPINWLRPSDCWPRWSNQWSDDIGYGTPTFTGPQKRPSHGYNYNPYHTVGNDLPSTFSIAHEGPSHGYDYNPYNTIGNVLLPTFTMVYKTIKPWLWLQSIQDHWQRTSSNFWRTSDNVWQGWRRISKITERSNHTKSKGLHPKAWGRSTLLWYAVGRASSTLSWTAIWSGRA